ncbi:MAG: Gfo/Idh/MocA family protein [bacterium]
MVKVGILGVGFMGKMHFNVYSAYSRSRVVALADLDPQKLAGDWSSIGGNIEDARAAQVDLSGLHLHETPEQLFADPDVDVVDITLPTFLHAKYAVAALEAGKHVVCEKPMALRLAECDKMMAAARKARRQLFIAHCVRFWPEYVVLKRLIDGGQHGEVLSATFWRKSLTPTWSWDNWLMDRERSGGAVLDLHIHDTDFIHYVFGLPRKVRASGVVGAVSKGGVDHIVADYVYPDGRQVTAEGSWAMAPGFGFTCGFCVVMEKATVEFDAKTGTPLTVHPLSGESTTPKVPSDDGYVAELRHFVRCISKGEDSDVVTPRDARNAVAVCLAEERAVKSGRNVTVR